MEDEFFVFMLGMIRFMPQKWWGEKIILLWEII